MKPTVSRVVVNEGPGSLVLAALRSTPSTFLELLYGLNGLSPNEAIVELKKLRPESMVDAATVARLLADATAIVEPRQLDQISALPLPHPLDFEWRFTSETARLLLERALSVTDDGDTILLCGVPAVVLSAFQSDVDRKYLVLGIDNVIYSTLADLTKTDRRFLKQDSAGDVASAAIVDPPWYLDTYRRMINEVSRRCSIGAVVFTTLLPEGVRPSAANDRANIVSLAQDLGLEVTRQLPLELIYRTPLFELAALEQSGLRANLVNWRRGDLLVLAKRRHPLEGNVVDERISSFELTIKGARLRVLPAVKSFSELRPLGESDVFPTVSVRAENRSRANFWTSTNRAFEIDSNSAIVALRNVARAHGVALPSASGSHFASEKTELPIDQLSRLTEKIGQLLDREVADALRLAGEGTWLQTANDARFLSNSTSIFRPTRSGSKT